MDATITGGIDLVVASVSSALAMPVPILFALFYLSEGVKVANGDAEPVHRFVPRLVRNLVILWLATNLDAYNFYVRDFLCGAVPSWLTSAVSMGGFDSGNISSVASTFDGLYSQMWINVATIWQTVGVSFAFLAVVLTGSLCSLVVLICLAVTALYYVMAKFMIEIIVALGPVLIVCGMFDMTRPFLERAIGKIVSLILMMTITFLIVSVCIGLDTSFMASFTTNSSPGVAAGALPQLLQDMISIVGWFTIGTLAVVFVPRQIAYSIGTGVVFSGGSAIGLLALMSRVMPSSGPGGGGGKSPATPGGPSYGLGMNRTPIGTSQPLLPQAPLRLAAPPPPPPPPPFTDSTRR